MTAAIDIDTVAKAYARWAPVYDLVFGAVFASGRRASIAAAERVGGRILEDCSKDEFFGHPENRQPRTKDFLNKILQH